MHAASAMTRRVIVAPPELPLDAAWEVMLRHRIRHLPVVQARKLVGILSDRDILVRATLDDERRILVPGVRVALAMTPAPFVAQPTTPVGEIARLMIAEKIDAVPVVDTSDHVLGLVTSTDLLNLLVGEAAKKPLPFQFELEDADRAANA